MDKSMVHTSSSGSKPCTGGSFTGFGAISSGFSVWLRSSHWGDGTDTGCTMADMVRIMPPVRADVG